MPERKLRLPVISYQAPVDDACRKLALAVVQRAILDRIDGRPLKSNQFTLTDVESARWAIDEGGIEPWLLMAGVDPSWALPILRRLISAPSPDLTYTNHRRSLASLFLGKLRHVRQSIF